MAPNIKTIVFIAVFLYAKDAASAQNVTVEKSSNSSVKFIVECELPQDGQSSKLVNVEYQPDDQLVANAKNANPIVVPSADRPRSILPRLNLLNTPLLDRLRLPNPRNDVSNVYNSDTTSTPSSTSVSPRESDDSVTIPDSDSADSIKESSAYQNAPVNPSRSSVALDAIKNLPAMPSIGLPALPRFNIPTNNLPSSLDSLVQPSIFRNVLENPASSSIGREAENKSDVPNNLPNIPSVPILPLINRNNLQLPMFSLPAIFMTSPSPKNDADSNAEASNARSVQSETNTMRALPTLPRLSSLLRANNIDLPNITLPPIIRNPSTTLKNEDSDVEASVAKNVNTLIPSRNSATLLNRDNLQLPRVMFPPITIRPISDIINNRLSTLTSARNSNDEKNVPNVPSLIQRPSTVTPLNSNGDRSQSLRITLPPIIRNPSTTLKNEDSNVEASVARNVNTLIPSRNSAALLNRDNLQLPRVTFPPITIRPISDIINDRLNTLTSARNSNNEKNGPNVPSLLQRPSNSNGDRSQSLRITLPPNISSLLSNNRRQSTKDDSITAASGVRNALSSLALPQIPSNNRDNLLSLLPTNNLPTISRNTKANTPNTLTNTRSRLGNFRDSLRPNSIIEQPLVNDYFPLDVKPLIPPIYPANIPSIIPDIRPNPFNIPSLPRPNQYGSGRGNRYDMPAANPLDTLRRAFPDSGMSASNQRIPSILTNGRSSGSRNRDQFLDQSQSMMNKAVTSLSKNANALANGFSATIGNAVDTIKRVSSSIVPTVNLPVIPPKGEVIVANGEDRAVGNQTSDRRASDDSIVEATNQNDACEVCDCLMKYLPNGFKNGKFIINNNDEMASASELKPSVIRPQRSLYNDDLLPLVDLNNLKLGNKLFDCMSDYEDLDQLENSINKLSEFVEVVEQFNLYINKKAKIVLTSLSKICENDFPEQLL